MANDTAPKNDKPEAKGEMPPSPPPPQPPPSKVGGEHQDIIPPRENHAPTQEPSPKKESIRITDWIIAGFTVVIALGTLYQGHIMKQAAIDSGIQTDKLICAANKQAAAADKFSTSAANLETTINNAEIDLKNTADNSRKAIEATQAAMRLDQRAWVGPVEVDGNRFNVDGKTLVAKEGEKIVVGVRIQNSGKTIAKKLTNCINRIAVSAGQKPDMSCTPTTPPSVSIMQPGQTFTNLAVETNIVTADALKELKAGTFTFYIFGRITYDDIFGKEHFTAYCLYLKPDVATFSSCNFYNDAN